MRKIYAIPFLSVFFVATAIFFFTGCKQKREASFKTEEENDLYDGPDKAIEFEIERTKDPATGKVPWTKLLLAIEQTKQAKSITLNNPDHTEALTWIERGPDSDVSGPSGNSRPNNDVTAGRVRAVMIDSLDPTHRTVWAGGVDGGLWKSTNITASPANWMLVNDFLSNLAIAAICQDPRPANYNTMYFCTGESYGNADAVRGVGVFKSIDGGVTWNHLSNTTSFTACTRILCDFQGNVYLATRNNGLQRSTDGGASWTAITPSGISANICDLEITSTAVASRLHVVAGISSPQAYRYTDIPSTVTTVAGWNAPTTAFPSFNNRAEIAVSGNVLYACPADASSQVPTVYKSTDGGDNWIATGAQPVNLANGQGWYDLSVGINPANSNECIVGGLDCHKTIDGGATWTRISTWASSSGQYVHADQHNIQWWDGGAKLLFACDGGIHYSSNGGTTIRDRNVGLRLKQFYSIAIHPTLTNYFLAGAQDNGVHQLTNPGLGASTEVYGGDGCYVAIDQNEPQFQFGSYVFNVYRRSTNGGANWSTPVNDQSSGRFVNPWDYDNSANIIYACHSAGQYLRWDNPQSGNTTTTVPVAAFNSGNVSAVHASPYTANRVFFGTGSGRIVRVDNANTATPTDINITPTGASGYANCIITGSSDQNLIACYSSYGVNNVWVSTNGGTGWTAIDGNLPDMPVRWALFNPDTDTKAYIATETGVWETNLVNGASTVWTPGTGFPSVRTDMIKYRSSDRTIAAGTHGRGVWTATIPLPSIGSFDFNSPAPVTASCPAPTSMSVTLGTISNGGFINPITLSATAGVPTGTTVTFGTNPVTPGGSSLVTLNNTNTLATGSYVIAITGTAAGTSNQTRNLTFTINTGIGPVISTQPSNQTLCAGTNTSFSIAATGATGYQWQQSTDGGGIYNAIVNGGIYSGVSTNTLTLTAIIAGMNNYRYRCIATSLCGNTTSGAAILTVRQLPTITLAAASLTSLFPGQSTILTAVPGASTGGVVTTNWIYNANPLIVAGNSYTVNVEKTGTYQVGIQETWPAGLVCSNLSPIVTIVAPPSSKLFMFPNPNNGIFTLSYYNSGGASTSRTATVYDSHGVKIQDRKFTVTGTYTLVTIDIKSAQKGIYLVVVGDANGKTLAKGKVAVQ
jgi:hypothetical protein